MPMNFYNKRAKRELSFSLKFVKVNLATFHAADEFKFFKFSRFILSENRLELLKELDAGGVSNAKTKELRDEAKVIYARNYKHIR